MRKIDGKTKICGLIGNPVEHTLSPLIHNLLAEKQGNNEVYLPFPVERGKLEEAITGAFALQIQGMNITVPYKSEVLPFLEEIDPLAAKIGAVNTLVQGKKGYIGYNTDMEGLYRAMKSDGISMENQEIILLGAGGAARAAAFMCATKGARSGLILNRSSEHAVRLAKEVNRAVGRECMRGLALTEYANLPERSYLAIQATSVGLYPAGSETLIRDSSFYKRIHTGYDLIYKPEITQFMLLTEQFGGKAFNGLKMLLYQAVIAYERMHRTAVPERDTEEIYSKLKEACQ